MSQQNQDGSQKQSQHASGTPSKTSRFLKPPRSAITKRAKQCDQNRPPAIAMELIGGLAQNHSLVSPAIHIDDTPHTGAHHLNSNARQLQAWPTSAQRKFASLTVLTPSEHDTNQMDTNSTLSRELSLRLPSSQVSSLETHRVPSFVSASPIFPEEQEPEEDDSFILFSQHDYVRASQANFTPPGSEEVTKELSRNRQAQPTTTTMTGSRAPRGFMAGSPPYGAGQREDSALDPHPGVDISYPFAPPPSLSSQQQRDDGPATCYPSHPLSQSMAFGSQFSNGAGTFSLPSSQAGAFSLPGSQSMVCDSLLGGLAAVRTSRASQGHTAATAERAGSLPFAFLGPSGASQDSSLLRVSLLTRSLHGSSSQAQASQAAPVPIPLLPSSLSQGLGQMYGSIESPLDNQILAASQLGGDADADADAALDTHLHNNNSSSLAHPQQQPMTAKGLICAFRNSTDNESAETPELQNCHDGNSARDSLGGGEIQPPSATGKSAGNQAAKPSRMFSIFLPKSQQRHVLMIRHGESEFNRAVDECRDFHDPMIFDPDLTAKGRVQARDLRSRLAAQISSHGDALWVVSPLRRTIQTFLHACPLIPLPPSPRLHPSLSSFQPPPHPTLLAAVMPPPPPLSSLPSFSSRSEPLYTVGSSTFTSDTSTTNSLHNDRLSSLISVETAGVSNAVGQSAFSFSFSSTSFSNSCDPHLTEAGPSTSTPFLSHPSSSSLPSSEACKLAHALSSPQPLTPQLNVVILPIISEFLTTAGDVGSPASALAEEFPMLSSQISAIPELWWYSSDAPAKKANCAKNKQLNSLEPKDHRSKRVRDFERWLSSRPEKFIILVGHCQFWHDFRGKKEKKMFNGEMRSFRW